MTKPLSLADRIKQQKKKNQEYIVDEKQLISSVKTGSGQGQVDTGASQYIPYIDKGFIKGQENIRSGSGQGQVSDIRSSQITLAPQQQKIYQWFLNNGFTGYFNKGVIHRETGINTPTIRKCISKIIKLNLVSIGEYNPVSRQQKYSINTTKKVNILSGSSQVSGQGQVKVRSFSYKKDRKIFNKLSIYLEKSDFWKHQSLTIQKCQEWVSEIEYCDFEYLFSQLQFAENTTNVINADNPINYFYKTILTGGFMRPTGFLFPEEMAEKLKEIELKEQEKLLVVEVSNRNKEKELANKKSFLVFLKDNNLVKDYIKKIENQFLTPKMSISIKTYKSNGKIDARLETILKRLFFDD